MQHVNAPADDLEAVGDLLRGLGVRREQGVFAAYAEDLYGLAPDRQRSKVFVELASKHHLDAKRFAKCPDDSKITQRMNGEIETARFIGITATPRFWWDGGITRRMM